MLKISARVVIVDAAGCVLVVRRVPTSTHFEGQWEFPGGKTDEGEEVEHALRREVLEETGLVLRLGRVLGADEFSLPGKRIAVLFLEAAPTAGAVRLSEEHDAFRWVTPAELPSLDLAPPCRKIARHYADETARRATQAPASKP
ncbi:MAG TPA: NUDIX domain-containing protein [Rariglobus sp.]